MASALSSRLRAAGAAAALAAATICSAQPASVDEDSATTTPIKHVIIIVGENHTFDNLFGTYQPQPGQTIRNLLSLGIVNA
ncbi:MAG TPA: alkaline phosphatase family protein, partial [Steroidobacteraceae bacterium]